MRYPNTRTSRIRGNRGYRRGMLCGARGHWPEMLERADVSPFRKPYNLDVEVATAVARCRICRGVGLYVHRTLTALQLESAAAGPEALREAARDVLRADLRAALTRGQRW